MLSRNSPALQRMRVGIADSLGLLFALDRVDKTVFCDFVRVCALDSQRGFG
jgi:hypothetical protein